MAAQLGQDVFDALSDAAGRGVALRIVQSLPTGSFPDDDSAALAKLHPNIVSLRSINMTNVLGGGIVHTKFWVVDASSIFVGSANMDWRSPPPPSACRQHVQLKSPSSPPVGPWPKSKSSVHSSPPAPLLPLTSPPLSNRASPRFPSMKNCHISLRYWLVAATQQLPATWPSNTHTNINQRNPATDLFNGHPTQVCPCLHMSACSLQPPSHLLPSGSSLHRLINSAPTAAGANACRLVHCPFPSFP
jgi:hypothetical protein